MPFMCWLQQAVRLLGCGLERVWFSRMMDRPGACVVMPGVRLRQGSVESDWILSLHCPLVRHMCAVAALRLLLLRPMSGQVWRDAWLKIHSVVAQNPSLMWIIQRDLVVSRCLIAAYPCSIIQAGHACW